MTTEPNRSPAPSHRLVPVEPTEAMLRPFYECPPDELKLAWMVMLKIAEVQAQRSAVSSEITATPCREDGCCQYAIDHGAEGLGACPVGKCAHMDSDTPASPAATPTPRTNAAEFLSGACKECGKNGWYVVYADFARQLERELEMAKMQNFDHETAIAALERELAEARSQLAEIRKEIAERIGVLITGEAASELSNVLAAIDAAIKEAK